MSRGPKSEQDFRECGFVLGPKGWFKPSKKNENHSQVSSAKPEQVICHDALAKAQGKEGNPIRRKVSIVSFRKRLIDPDNLAPKFFIDALRYAGIIKDDTAKHITLEVRQEKSDDPRTEITIE